MIASTGMPGINVEIDHKSTDSSSSGTSAFEHRFIIGWFRSLATGNTPKNFRTGGVDRRRRHIIHDQAARVGSSRQTVEADRPVACSVVHAWRGGGRDVRGGAAGGRRPEMVIGSPCLGDWVAVPRGLHPLRPNNVCAWRRQREVHTGSGCCPCPLGPCRRCAPAGTRRRRRCRPPA
jgi:hypothetical protein